MTTIMCRANGDLPKEFKEAGENGILSVKSTTGWIKLSAEDVSDGGKNGCQYMIWEESQSKE
jgi:hypothetical protein